MLVAGDEPKVVMMVWLWLDLPICMLQQYFHQNVSFILEGIIFLLPFYSAIRISTFCIIQIVCEYNTRYAISLFFFPKSIFDFSNEWRR